MTGQPQQKLFAAHGATLFDLPIEQPQNLSLGIMTRLISSSNN
jgi:hypothetical protein